MTYDQMPEGRDPQLWELAKRRASFKTHLLTYFILNLFFWILWYVTGAATYGNSGLPWPVWPSLGWGIGVAFHYFGAYGANDNNRIEKEYNKLKNKNNQTV